MNWFEALLVVVVVVVIVLDPSTSRCRRGRAVPHHIDYDDDYDNDNDPWRAFDVDNPVS